MKHEKLIEKLVKDAIDSHVVDLVNKRIDNIVDNDDIDAIIDNKVTELVEERLKPFMWDSNTDLAALLSNSLSKESWEWIERNLYYDDIVEAIKSSIILKLQDIPATDLANMLLMINKKKDEADAEKD